MESMSFVHDITPLIREAVEKAEKQHPDVRFMAEVELTEDMKLIITVRPETADYIQ